jgi:hypothetical protein
MKPEINISRHNPFTKTSDEHLLCSAEGRRKEREQRRRELNLHHHKIPLIYSGNSLSLFL